MQVYDGPQWMWKLRLQFFSSHWAILDLIGKTEYRWIVRFKRSTQHPYFKWVKFIFFGTFQPQFVNCNLLIIPI